MTFYFLEQFKKVKNLTGSWNKLQKVYMFNSFSNKCQFLLLILVNKKSDVYKID